MPNTNLSYWEHQSFFGPADVAIIGAGLVGLTAALYLKQRRPNWRVVVLERGALPSGASTKNAGFACFGSISELMEQEKRGDLQAVVAARWDGLARLRELLGDAALDYQPVGGYELFRHEEAALAAECREKIDYFNDLLAPVVGHARTFRDASAEAGPLWLCGRGHPAEKRARRQPRRRPHDARPAGPRLGRRCARADQLRAWKHWKPAGHRPPRCAWPTAPAMAAGQVLLATNAFATELLPELAVAPGRGQVLVTEPLPDVRLPGTFHYDHGYAYFRQLPDHRILLGGGRNLDFAAEETTAPGLTARGAALPGKPAARGDCARPAAPHRLPLERGDGLRAGAGAYHRLGAAGRAGRRALQRHGRGPGRGHRLGGGP